MKTILSLAFAALLVGCGHSPVTPTPPAPPVLTWTSNGNPNVSACSATVQTNCLASYTLTDTTTGQVFTVAINVLTYMPTGTITIGSHTYNLIVNGIDNTGNTLQSKPATTTVVIP
jgi:hypothetical protein